MNAPSLKPPETGQKVYFPETTVRKFVPYKKDGQRQMKRKGRWQEMVWHGDYFKWENCETPETDNWYLGDDDPNSPASLKVRNDALVSALGSVLQDFTDLCECGDCGIVSTDGYLSISEARTALALAKGLGE